MGLPESFEWRGLAQEAWHSSSCSGLQVDQCLHARVAAQHMLPRPRTRIELKPEVRCTQQLSAVTKLCSSMQPQANKLQLQFETSCCQAGCMHACAAELLPAHWRLWQDKEEYEALRRQQQQQQQSEQQEALAQQDRSQRSAASRIGLHK